MKVVRNSSALVLLIAVVFPSLLLGQDTLAIIQVGRLYDFIGDAHDIALDGNYAYLVDGYPGMHIIDISDPLNPFKVRYVDVDGYTNRLLIEEHKAYILSLIHI